MSNLALIPFSTDGDDENAGHVARGLTLEFADWLRDGGADPVVLTSAQTEEDGAWRKLVSFSEELSPDAVAEYIHAIQPEGPDVEDAPEFSTVISGILEPVGGDETFGKGIRLAVTVMDLSANFSRGRFEFELMPGNFGDAATRFMNEVADAAELEVEADYNPLTRNFQAWLNLLITRALGLAADVGAIARDASGVFEPALEAMRLDSELTVARDRLGELAQVLVLERGFEPGKAISALDHAETRVGRDWRSQCVRGHLMLANQKFGPAAKAFCQVLSGRYEAPDKADRLRAALMAGKAFNLADRPVEAQRVLSLAMQEENLRVDAIVESASSSAAMGERAVAERLWRRALELEPQSVTARLQLARLYRSMGKLNETGEQYQKVLKTKGLPREVFADATEFFVINQMHSDAQTASERYVEEYPGDALGHILLASTLNSLGQHKRALKALNQAEVCAGVDEFAGLVTRQRRFAENPGVEDEFRKLAEKAIGGDAAVAEKSLRKLTNRFPDFIEGYLFLGIALRRQDKWQQARDVLENLRDESDLPGVDKELTGVYSQLNQPEKALECARRAMDATPEDASLIVNYAAALLENNKIDEALRYARRAEMHLPDDPAVKKLNELIRLKMQKRGLIRNLGAVFKEAIGEATRVVRKRRDRR